LDTSKGHLYCKREKYKAPAASGLGQQNKNINKNKSKEKKEREEVIVAQAAVNSRQGGAPHPAP